MITLHIEHRISDYPTWRRAFARFEGARDQAGVLADRVRHPVDDPHLLMIELDFDTVERATAFRDFLTTQVWTTPASAPALVGAPRTRLLRRPAEPTTT
jgi:hypothetical protein